MPLTLTQAITGFIHAKTAAGKSPYTIRNYRTSFAKLQTYLAEADQPDPPLASIDRATITDFLAWLHDPDQCGTELSPKSIRNIHADLSSLWQWAAEEGLVPTNIIRTIEPPDPKPPTIDPFTQSQIEALLTACQHTRTDDGPANAIADRNRLIVLLLLDTGLRASELCAITLDDIDLAANKIRVIGKGGKPRFVYFGKRTAKALWRHIAPRLTAADRRLFTVGPAADPRPLTRFHLRQILVRLGQRAGVPDVYPHRFRHTFAITYLRNGGDLFTLQELLGHSDLEMVRRYARIAQTDCARAHQKASPVDNWRL